MTKFWDQHACPTLSVDADIAECVTGYSGDGARLVSLNVGYEPHDGATVNSLISSFSEQIEQTEGARLALTFDDIAAATDAGEVAVVFDLEDTAPLDEDVANVEKLFARGVRTMLPTYNHGNAAGGGCLDPVDEGLTAYGRDIIRAMNEVGMVVDAAHTGRMTGFELCSVSTRPVIYSHVGMRGIWDSVRNIDDDQARTVADTGGVVGVCGVGIFLGANDASLAAMIRHLEYAISVVGIDHVGIGSDYSFELADINRTLRAHPHLFPEEFTRYGDIMEVSPVEFLTLPEALAGEGYAEPDIDRILWKNFSRVAEQNWSAA